MSSEELAERGFNQSITHVDFMIGSEEMDIDGVLEDGTVEPVFRKWQLGILIFGHNFSNIIQSSL